LALPTIDARPGLAEETAAVFRSRTRESLDVVVTREPGGWCAGLNDVWRRRGRACDVFVCASDDMRPHDEGWLPPLLSALERGELPAPTVIDPRWTNYGGHLQPVPDGTPSEFSTFPVLRRQWLPLVFPLPDDLHYFGDNLIAARLERSGIPCVAVPSSVIDHACDLRGRGAGAGSEGARMDVDAERFRRTLAEDGCPTG
jgi:hypothetical protein